MGALSLHEGTGEYEKKTARPPACVGRAAFGGPGRIPRAGPRAGAEPAHPPHGGAAGAADDMASGTKKAAKAAKDLKTHLLGIDELNVVEPDKDTGTNGGGGSGGGTGVSGAGGDSGFKYIIKEAEGLYKSSIKNLNQLGKYISDSLSKAMESIKWNRVYKKAKNFGKGLADFLNGLITPRLFSNLGSTIAGVIQSRELSRADIANLQAILAEKAKTAPEEVQCNCLPGDQKC